MVTKRNVWLSIGIVGSLPLIGACTTTKVIGDQGDDDGASATGGGSSSSGFARATFRFDDGSTYVHNAPSRVTELNDFNERSCAGFADGYSVAVAWDVSLPPEPGTYPASAPSPNVTVGFPEGDNTTAIAFLDSGIVTVVALGDGVVHATFSGDADFRALASLEDGEVYCEGAVP